MLTNIRTLQQTHKKIIYEDVEVRWVDLHFFFFPPYLLLKHNTAFLRFSSTALAIRSGLFRRQVSRFVHLHGLQVERSKPVQGMMQKARQVRWEANLLFAATNGHMC